jgi:hypothetical protein
MPNIVDYLKWRGDIQLGYSPFNDVDNLILAEFSYLLLEMADQPCEGLSVKAIAPLLENHPEAYGFIDADDTKLMLDLMASSKRLGMCWSGSTSARRMKIRKSSLPP